MEQRQKWRRLNGERIRIPIAEEVSNVLARETSNGYELKVYIGTDSQVKGKETEFATVIVFLRKGVIGCRLQVAGCRFSCKQADSLVIKTFLNV